jgi:endonuclease/exonuclease/phosphatase family metal-dependent hydrolase
MMEAMRLVRLAVALGLLPSLAFLPGACTTALNYTDPLGPRYASSHGRLRPAGQQLRVVTFNIKHAEQIERAIEVLSAERALREADLLLLQEMDAPGTERIARALGLNSIYFPSTVHPHNGRDFGNALLSPWPIEDARKLLLPHESRLIKQRRGVTVGTVRIASRPLRVYSIHVETILRMSGALRREQVEAILEDARRSPHPVVIAGDLNSRGLAPLFEKAGYWWLTRDVHDTAAFFDFDHVFARGLHPAAQPAAGAEPNRGASDHKPVWAVLRFD